MTKAEHIKALVQATRERLKEAGSRFKPGLPRGQIALGEPEERLHEDTGKVHEVQVKVQNAFERRKLTLLGSQVKQEIRDRLKDSLRSLARLRAKGHSVGRLRFNPFVNSIPLKQYGVTYQLDPERNKVRIQKLGTFRALGLHQLPKNGEIASALLVRKPSRFYLHVVVYVPKDEGRPSNDAGGGIKPGPVDVDLGIKHQLTLSNGLRFQYKVPVSERGRRLQQKLSRQKKGSRNYEHPRHLLTREYERLNSRKRDIQNKFLSFLKRYPTVVIQDDQVKGWQDGLFGGKVHSTAIGGLKGRLKASLPTPVVVEAYEATSRECFRCGVRLDLTLSDWHIRCSCGWEADRDQNAALVILRKGLGLRPEQALGLDRPEVTPLEIGAAGRTRGSPKAIPAWPVT